MKSLAVLALAIATLAPCGVAAQTAHGPGLLGAWAVDTSRLPMPPQARPKSVTITFSAVGADRLRAKVEVIDPTGALLQAEGTTPLDGSPTAVASNFEADMSATTMPRPEVLIMQLARGGSPASTRIYTVTPDGAQMTEVVAYFGPDGRPVLRTNHFSRLR